MKLSYFYSVTNGGLNSYSCKVNMEHAGFLDNGEDLASVYAKYQNSEGKYTALAVVKQGIVISVVKQIGRDHDFKCTKVFIPSNVIISGREIVEIIQQIKTLYDNGTPTKGIVETTFTNDSILYKDFGTRKVTPQYNPQKTTERAFVKASARLSKAEILNKLYLPEYERLAEILIFDKDENLKDATKLADLKDFTGHLNQNVIFFTAPSRGEVEQKLGKGVSIWCDGTEVAPAQCLAKVVKNNDSTSTIMLTFKKPGRDKIDCPFNVKDDEPIDLKDARMEWQKTVTLNDFSIQDEKGNKIHNPKITVNGQQLTNRGLPIKESDLGNVKVEVSATGYEDKNKDKKHDLSGNSTELITMTKTLEKYELNDRYDYRGDRYKIIIEGPRAKSNFVDLRKLGIIKNETVSIWESKGAIFFYGMLTALAIAAILMWFDIIPGKSEEKAQPAKTHQSAPEPKTVNDPKDDEKDQNNAEAKAKKAAVEYLNTHDVWTRKELESISELQGFFDELNTRNFAAVEKRIVQLRGGDSLKKDSNLEKLLFAVTKNKNKQLGSYGATDSITVGKYIQKLNNAQEPNPGNAVTDSQKNDREKNNTGKKTSTKITEQVGKTPKPNNSGRRGIH